jgi:hypothetical protein
MEVLMVWMKSAARGVAFVVLASGSSSATSEEQSIGQLKETYLACEHAARSTEFRGDDMMQCSITYEALKQRAFAGEFRLLRTWYESLTPSASASQ